MGGLKPIAPEASGRLRIAYVVGAFPTISETFIVGQIAGIAARGHHVDIYTTSDARCLEVPPEVERLQLLRRVCRLNAGRGGASGIRGALRLLLGGGWRVPRVVARVLREIWRNRGRGSVRLLHAALTLARRGAPTYDAVHAQFGPYGLLALQLQRVGVLRGPIVTSFRGYDVDKYLRARPDVYDELFLHGAFFLPVSRMLAARLLDAGCPPARLKVHYSGIDCRRIDFRDSRVGEGGPVRVITVGRLVEKKGIAYGIQAVARLLATGRSVAYAIVGEGPLRQELSDLIVRLGVAADVRLLGSQPHDETLRLIGASHVLLAPSVTAVDGDAEGIPNVVKEAMASGLPILATRHGGMEELVIDGVSGWVVPERNVEALAAKLGSLIDHPQTWAAMARAGRAMVEKHFDIERLNDELEELYRRACAAHSQTPDTYRRGAPHSVSRKHFKRDMGRFPG